MIFGIGVDTVDVERFKKRVTQKPALLDRLFYADEISSISSFASLSGRFAAKEAFAKAAKISIYKTTKLIKIRGGGNKSPFIEIISDLKQAITFNVDRARIHLSIAHDSRIATANVVIEMINI